MGRQKLAARIRPEHVQYWYDGDLIGTTEHLKKAINAYNNLHGRCRRSERYNYKYYGAIGIDFKFSQREFIGWYLEKYSTKKWECASVSRIDHSKNYTFDNMVLCEKSDNVGERNRRHLCVNKHFWERKFTVYSKQMEPLASFKHGKYACLFVGCDHGAIRNYLKKNINTFSIKDYLIEVV